MGVNIQQAPLGLLWSSHIEWAKFTATLYHWIAQRLFLFWTRVNVHIPLNMDIVAEFGLRIYKEDLWSGEPVIF